jgi:hypothetical protein
VTTTATTAIAAAAAAAATATVAATLAEAASAPALCLRPRLQRTANGSLCQSLLHARARLSPQAVVPLARRARVPLSRYLPSRTRSRWRCHHCHRRRWPRCRRRLWGAQQSPHRLLLLLKARCPRLGPHPRPRRCL